MGKLERELNKLLIEMDRRHREANIRAMQRLAHQIGRK
jgi:hypothetical protein